MSKVLSVRISEELYTKLYTGRKSRTETVSLALNQYFNSRQRNKPQKMQDDPIIQGMRQQISQMKAMQEHMTDEILYLRELHQVTMNRVLQLPENTAYDRDSIQDMQNLGDEETHHHQHANCITWLGNVIATYKDRM